jgi:tRNA(Ile)-lysidine synthetase-like protein
MIEEGDKIAVALSGGKDSITLLHGLKTLQRFYPKHFDLIAISINPGFEFFDEVFLKNICDNVDVPLIIENYDIKSIVFNDRKEKNPCSLCANLRRGILNTTAKKEGCNKLALGHNLDDVLETFLMNFFYAGNLNTFAPINYMSKSGLTVIRPLIYVAEKETKKYTKRNNISVMPKVCPMDGKSTREDMKNLINSLSVNLPYIRSNMIGAIQRNNINGWKETN